MCLIRVAAVAACDHAAFLLSLPNNIPWLPISNQVSARIRGPDAYLVAWPGHVVLFVRYLIHRDKCVHIIASAVLDGCLITPPTRSLFLSDNNGVRVDYASESQAASAIAFV